MSDYSSRRFGHQSTLATDARLLLLEINTKGSLICAWSFGLGDNSLNAFAFNKVGNSFPW
jgi:hypothetical protein